MSERRCVHGYWNAAGYCPQNKQYCNAQGEPQSQDVASSVVEQGPVVAPGKRVTPKDPQAETPVEALRPGTDGAASCDSELDAIRERLARSDSSLWETGAARTLLRMVDELTKDIAFMAANEATVQKERDELRAKLDACPKGENWLKVEQLAKENDELRSKNEQIREALRRSEQNELEAAAESDELRSKLADQEPKLLASMQAVNRAAHQMVELEAKLAEADARAEAAEARGRELESRHGLPSDDAEAIKRDLNR